jgi:hypothetical protein
MWGNTPEGQAAPQHNGLSRSRTKQAFLNFKGHVRSQSEDSEKIIFIKYKKNINITILVIIVLSYFEKIDRDNNIVNIWNNKLSHGEELRLKQPYLWLLWIIHVKAVARLFFYQVL